MVQGLSTLFKHIKSQPNPQANPALWKHRLRQRRPLSIDPFARDDELVSEPQLPGAGSHQDQQLDLNQTQLNDKANDESREDATSSSSENNKDLEWGEQIPNWLNLFFDLAWTATFSSLTSNNKFWLLEDSFTYVLFFPTTWWLWTSQVIYNAEFYTDDWFHLVCIFIQLIIFGALAATARDFDITHYISRSPGSAELEPYNIETMSPDEYSAERLAKVSLSATVAVLAISRVLLLIQHVRIMIYAWGASKSSRPLVRLAVVPLSLLVSAGLLWTVFGMTLYEWSREPTGAKLKFVLWGVALFIEISAHAIRLNLDIGPGLRLLSHGSVSQRFSDITAIILGEGLNAIAGTFYTVQKAPGFTANLSTPISCCAVIILLIAYLYFEGAAPLKPVRRRALWVIAHLPWLLSLILFLEAVKNQLTLLNFINTMEYFLKNFGKAAEFSMDMLKGAQFNSTMRPVLLRAGLEFNEEYAKLDSAFRTIENQNVTDEAAFGTAWGTWLLRTELSGILSLFETIVDADTITESSATSIDQYMSNDSYVEADLEAPGLDIPHMYAIIEDLIKPSLMGARYILLLCGLMLVSLATLNLIQSWPRDRFHWGSVFSRYAMGLIAILLLNLNVGKYQNFILLDGQDRSHQAPVLRWIEDRLVLPTLAFIYITQVAIDAVLVVAATWYGCKRIAQEEEAVQVEELVGESKV